MKRHVAVLMGGLSSERSVSLLSGEACAAALVDSGYRVSRVDVGPDLAEVLAALKPDVAFNALHGQFGEDGIVQGILEMQNIPYTHSGVLASALAMQKDRAKVVLKAAGVPVAEGITVSRFDAARSHILAPPYVIKPVSQGSSVGVIIVDERQSHPPQYIAGDDWRFGDHVLVERYVPGRELTCAVMGDRALGVIEIKPESGRFYNFDSKYSVGGSTHIFPANLLPNIYHLVQKLTLEAHHALGCRGLSRADFRYDDTSGGTGEVVCLEVNTQPGMTSTSLVPELAAHEGVGFCELVEWMVIDASCGR
jgi:D-alanine-D-alanine ligase